eukprot:258381_1
MADTTHRPESLTNATAQLVDNISQLTQLVSELSSFARCVDETDIDACVHLNYSSSQTFVRRLLGLLHPQLKLQQDAESILTYGDLLRMPSIAPFSNMCCHCCIVLLSETHVNNILKNFIMKYIDFSEPPKEISFGNLAEFAFWCLCNNVAKFYKIIGRYTTINEKMYIKGEQIMKMNKSADPQCMRYAHEFHFICNMAVSKRHTRFMYLRNLFLSVKYWNSYQLIFFVNHHAKDLFNFLLDAMVNNFEMHSIAGDEVGAVRQIITASWILISNKYFRLPVSMLSLITEHSRQFMSSICKYYSIEHMNNLERIQLKEQIKKCGWCGIILALEDEQVNLKLKCRICKQCKMIYYCSRFCQKISWNTEHRNVCRRLSDMYSC